MISKLLADQLSMVFNTVTEADDIDIDNIFPGNTDAQAVYPLAYAYKTDFKGNKWAGNELLLSVIKKLGRRAIKEILAKDSNAEYRRTGYPLFHAFDLVRNDLQDIEEWEKNLKRAIKEVFLPILQEREKLDILSSANVGYGTNHLAAELSGLSAYARVCKNGYDFGSITSGKELFRYAREWLDRFMYYMDEGGYWPECDGPAQIYNSLTANALLRTAIDLGKVEKYRQQFEKAARYHTYFMFPNLYSVGVTDGRNHHRRFLCRLSFCGFIPEGRGFLKIVTKDNYKQNKEGKRFGGEALNEFMTDINAQPFFSGNESISIWKRKDYNYSIRDDFALLKQGDWMTAVSNVSFRPRPEGHWNFDFQNLFSLYHKRFGIVLRGNNSKNDPELSTFHKTFTMSDGYPLSEPVWEYIPEKGRLEIRENGFFLMRGYRGFEGILNLEIVNDITVLLRIEANTRMSEYPVTFSLQPAAGYGRGVSTGNGRELDITEKSFVYTYDQLDGAIILKPEDMPDVETEEPGRPVKLTIPKGAELFWPYKGWNCYNLKTDRYTHAEDWTLVLKIPVYKEGTELAIEML